MGVGWEVKPGKAPKAYNWPMARDVSRSAQDYLKAIYKLQSDAGPVQTSAPALMAASRATEPGSGEPRFAEFGLHQRGVQPDGQGRDIPGGLPGPLGRSSRAVIRSSAISTRKRRRAC